MFRNYLTTAFRSLKRQKGFALLNLAGLAVGLAACLLIGLYIQHELSFDRFHERADEIYRIGTDWGDQLMARTPLPAGPLLEETYPAIAKSARFFVWEETLVEHEDRGAYEDGFAYTDPGFFELFDFKVLQGDPEIDLARPFTVFLSRSMAEQYFPGEDAIGRTLRLHGEHDFEVVGLFEDIPANSHIRFDFLSSIESEYATGLDRDRWDRVGYTYLLIPDAREAARLDADLTDFFQQHLPERMAQAETPFFLTPLLDIRLYAQQEWEMLPQGDIRYVYLFSAIALLILLIACINYMNLATARAMRRSREVGVRKSMGATRGELARQFLSESLVLVCVAVMGAVLLAWLAVPAFNNVLDTSISLSFDGWMLPVLVAATLLVGTLAGSYPAAYLSGFAPVQALRERISGRDSGRLRRVLVVFQFALSAALIVATLGLHQQMQLVQEQRPGFDREQIVMMPTRGAVGDHYEALREEMLRHPSVEQVTLGSYEARRGTAMLAALGSDAVEGATFEDTERVYGVHADAHFLDTFGLELLEGRNLRETDTDVALVNEAAVRTFGWENPIGKRVRFAGEQEIIGVVEDFPLGSLHERIPPALLYPGADGEYAKMAARVHPGDLDATLGHLEAQWGEFVPGHPFVYSFLDADFDALYRAEMQLAQLFTIAALLAILVASLGLIGLAAFMAQTRRKEIGIRKVLGASVQSVVALLSKDFLKLVAVAFVLGAPVAYYGLSRWLESFAYRIDVGAGLFTLAAVLLLTTAFLAVGYQALRAALMDPTEAIRHE